MADEGEDRGPTERLDFRCPRGLARRVRAMAKDETRTRTGMIVRLLVEAIEARERVLG